MAGIDGQCCRTLTPHRPTTGPCATPGALRGGLSAVDRHPTLDHIVAAGADGTPRVYRIHRHAKRVIGDDANHIFPLFPLAGRVTDLRFSPDGKQVAAVGGLDGRGELVVASWSR